MEQKGIVDCMQENDYKQVENDCMQVESDYMQADVDETMQVEDEKQNENEYVLEFGGANQTEHYLVKEKCYCTKYEVSEKGRRMWDYYMK